MTQYESSSGQLFSNQAIAKRLIAQSFSHGITGYQQKFMEEAICGMLCDRVVNSLQRLNLALVLSLHGDSEELTEK